MQPTFTVVTPTYNRAHTLPNVYAALQAQTLRDFEWIIVDDGSTDATADLVAQWRPAFSLHYHRRENGGKPSAVNLGISLAKGAYIVILDDDDTPVPEALAVFADMLATAPPDVGLVGCLTMSASGAVIGTRLDAATVEITHLDAYSRRGFTGDKWLAFRADVARRFPYPVYDREKFVSEGIVFNRMSRAGYKARYIDKPLLIHEYLPDGLTQNHLKLKDRNPIGFIAYHAENISGQDAALSPYYLKSAANYYALLFFRARRPVVTALLLFSALPIGIAKGLLDRRRLRSMKRD